MKVVFGKITDELSGGNLEADETEEKQNEWHNYDKSVSLHSFWIWQVAMLPA